MYYFISEPHKGQNFPNPDNLVPQFGQKLPATLVIPIARGSGKFTCIDDVFGTSYNIKLFNFAKLKYPIT